ncbi:MAG TPA: cytochrome-c peroxidase, partial [Chitinophagaceae bacterium]|nr:cytochrome-c peroxidase [Chitinophagaceae bacterium]
MSFDTTHDAKIKFISPKGWPKTVFNVSKFSISEQGFQLGRRLFYDPILSKDSTISCASCHLQATGFAHVDHKLSHGIQGLFGPRNAPSLMNLAWNKSFMWDGGVQHLEEQAISPITNKLEMDETMDHVILKLNRSSRYKQLFKSAYDDTLINQKHFLNAITQFLVQLNSFDSKYDRYTKKQIEFTSQEINGLKLFRANCATCHTEPLFTNSSFEN